MPKYRLLSAVAVAAWLTIVRAQEESFCYTQEFCGPQTWPGVCNTGRRQSPIMLVKEEAVVVADRPLQFRNYDQVGNFHLTMNGIHGKIPTFRSKENGDAYVEGGPILSGARYFFNQSHFHWGQLMRDSTSEHRIPGRRFVGEAHYVHFHEDFLRGVPLPPGEDQITVVAFFLEMQDVDNPRFDALIREIRRAHASGHIANRNEEELNKFESNATYDMVLPDDYARSAPYFHYEGSLTTPPCSETVNWIVMDTTIKISDAQIQSYFRDHVRDPGRMSTFRPLQAVNGRQVSYYPGGSVAPDISNAIVDELPTYNSAYKPNYNPSYQPQPVVYQPQYQPAYQPAYQPSYKPSYQPSYQPPYQHKPQYSTPDWTNRWSKPSNQQYGGSGSNYRQNVYLNWQPSAPPSSSSYPGEYRVPLSPTSYFWSSMYKK